MGEYYRYLPLLFLGRTINSKASIGIIFTKQDREFFKKND